ncbi:MAG: T9SS type A sorting domain-containing protein, partial [Saprospiraceae bacterium]|nr:T9SS type A sorting domain-containing protein [Saprospiraceae bacterium]
FKFSTASGNAGFNGRPYKLYFRTQNTAHNINSIDEAEMSGNGGSDCGQPSKQIFLGRDIFAVQEVSSGCNIDEFYLNLGAGDFNSAGDHLEIYIEEVGGGGSGIDQRIYYIWSGSRSQNIINDLAVQTRTNFAGLPSGKGAMNYLNFKPNGSQFTCMTGDEEYPYFFFDVEQAHSTTGTAYRDWNKFLWDTVGIRGYRMDAVKHFPPWFVGALLNEMHAAGMNPPMVVGEHFTSFAPALKSWVDGVYNSMDMSARNAISVRAFDFELRQALKDACDNGLFDVRNIYQSGLVGNPATLMNGNNAVTFVNNHDYRTSSEHILNRMMLAYAYILTNNKIGLPCVFYPDYYGVNIYGPSNPIPAMQSQIDQLMQVHKNYIAGATFVDYLNRNGTPYGSAYLQSGPYDLLLYQIQYGPVPNKDVIVAINFENQPLRVNHTINTFRAPVGTQFNLIAGTANTPAPVVEANSPNNIPNSIYLDIPAYSYAVFVQGAILPVTLTTFEAAPKNKSVQLSWAAETEDQFSGYEVQRSLDGQTYQKLAWVDAKGTSGGPAKYELYDKQPVFNQPMYYRLRMVDLDGSADFSPIRSVTLQQKEEVVLFPNPSKGQFFLRFEEAVQPGTLLEIFDALGSKLSQRTLQEGALLEEINLDGAANGVYRVRVVRAGQVVYQGVMHHIR